MSLVYSPQAAQQLSSSRSMSMTSVHMRLAFIKSGEENSIGEPGVIFKKGGILWYLARSDTQYANLETW